MQDSGILCLYKPVGISSFRVLSSLKKAFNTRKVGHMGTLDPLAEGVLPVAVGKYTRLIPYITLVPKLYELKIYFGEESKTLDSQDVDLKELSYNKVEFDLNEIKLQLESFCGSIMQAPPAFSAVKINGQRAYTLARANTLEDSAMKKREVTMFDFKILNWEDPVLTLQITCGSGFYVRSLVRDLASQLKQVAFMLELKRLAVGPFKKENCSTEESIELLDLKDLISYTQIIEITELEAKRVKNGITSFFSDLEDGVYLVKCEGGYIALLDIKEQKFNLKNLC